jgi:hypothetical protein
MTEDGKVEETEEAVLPHFTLICVLTLICSLPSQAAVRKHPGYPKMLVEKVFVGEAFRALSFRVLAYLRCTFLANHLPRFPGVQAGPSWAHIGALGLPLRRGAVWYSKGRLRDWEKTSACHMPMFLVCADTRELVEDRPRM